jgi:hypothetical protein
MPDKAMKLISARVPEPLMPIWRGGRLEMLTQDADTL